MICNPDLEALWELFQSQYTIIQASGGLVTNTNGEHLLIFRNGKWDLPKGKLEENEELETAALREVEEECGISNLTIEDKLNSTYHTYQIDGDKILKESQWFAMSFSGSESLTPQLEEGIEKAEWMDRERRHEAQDEAYGAINDVLSILT